VTRVGSGGAVISRIDFTKRFKRQYEKIPPEIKKLVPSKRKYSANPYPTKSSG